MAADVPYSRPRQLGFDLDESRPDPDIVDPALVRDELHALLAVARAAQDVAPWDRRTHRYYAVVFPQMATWLPADEAADLCDHFRAELDRIEPLLRPA